MKKIWLIPIAIITIGLLTIIYQQHQLLKDYRSIVYYEMNHINIAIERLFELHKKIGIISDTDRENELENIQLAFSDFSSYSAGGIHLYPQVGERYYAIYNHTRITYALNLNVYVEATTHEEREIAYENLKGEYERYVKFLEEVEQKYGEQFE